MAQVNVISVNPSNQTLGALTIENIERVSRSYCPTVTSTTGPDVKSVCNFIFGINKSVTPGFSGKLMFVRMMTSAAFLLTALSLSSTLPFGSALYVAAMIFAAMISLGFFARMAAFSAAVFGAICVAFAIPETSTILETTKYLSDPSLMLMSITSLGMLTVSVLGPGRFSFDRILNRSLYRTLIRTASANRERRRNRLAKERLSYKAWRSFK